MSLDVRILGDLAIHVDGRAVPLGGRRQRSVVAALVVAGGRPLSAASLADRLWPEETPPSAVKTVQAYVARTRAALGSSAGRLASSPAGYLLRLDDEEVDARRFEVAAGRGLELRRAGDPAAARSHLEAALAEWRGPVLGDLEDEPFVRAMAERLDELRLQARDELLAVRAEQGDPTVIGELRTATLEHPERVAPCRTLMLALYAAGRDVEALDAYHALRRHLRDELGLDPPTTLTELERAILAQELPRAGAPRSVAPPAASNAPAATTPTRTSSAEQTVPASAPPRPSPGQAAVAAPTRRPSRALAIVATVSLVVAFGAATGAIGMFAAAGRDDSAAAARPTAPGPTVAGSPSAPAAPSAGPATRAFPDPEERALLAELPAGLAASCMRGGTTDDARLAGWSGRAPTAFAGSPPVPIGWTTITPPVPIVGLTCRPGSGASRVYVQLHGVEGGGDATSVAATALALYRGRWRIDNGPCDVVERGAERWQSSRGGGSVACVRRHPHDGRPWIVWTFLGGRGLAFATRDDAQYEPLYGWWRETATFLR